MLDLGKGARPDEQGYFHRQLEEPVPHVTTLGPYRRTTWTNITNQDGSPGTFVSTWWWKLQWYRGTTKCDGSRTYMLRSGQLGTSPDDPTDGYIMTTLPKELSALRWRKDGPGEAVWSNMGGS